MKEIFKLYSTNAGRTRPHRIEVSNFGNVKVDGKLIDLTKYHGRYKQVHGLYVHRMVAELFIPNPENKWYVDHIDGDRYNNHVTNLRWATPSENRLNPISVARLAETNKRQDIHINRVNKHKGHIPWHNNCKFMNDKVVEVCVDWKFVGEFIDLGFMFGRLK